jgi:hypothetical protein
MSNPNDPSVLAETGNPDANKKRSARGRERTAVRRALI